MVQVVLVWPGSTDFDRQGRIQGQLDLPLCECGKQEVARAVSEMSGLRDRGGLCLAVQLGSGDGRGNCRAAGTQSQKIDALENVDLGLWQGLLRDDVKRKQPKVYRQWQDHPETVCPPEGESLDAAQQRLQKARAKVAQEACRGDDRGRGARPPGEPDPQSSDRQAVGRPVEALGQRQASGK